MPQNFDMMNSPEATALLKDKAALKALLDSPETKKLISALSSKNGKQLNAAAAQAKNGDVSALSAMVNDFAASREGSMLLNKLQGELPK